jgi:hypothetical protein
MIIDLRQGDVLDEIRKIPDASMSAVLSDVPYGLGSREPTAKEIAEYVLGTSGLDMGGDFMGSKWSVPSVSVWKEIYRVLKPGAPLLIFAGSRTQDLITIGMRAAGFEIGDCISVWWVTTMGMPKPATTTDKYLDWHLGVDREVVGERSMQGNARIKGGAGQTVESAENKYATAEIRETIPVTAATSPIAKRWDGYGHALRPSYEPVVLAYKPYDGTIGENVIAHEVGALNVKDCRLGTSGGTRKVETEKYKTNGSSLKGSADGSLNGGVKSAINAGRWPANCVIVHDPRCKRIGAKKVKSGTAVKRRGVKNNGALDGMHGLGTHPAGTADAGYGSGGKEETTAWECVEGCPARILDEQSGDRKSVPYRENTATGAVLNIQPRSAGGYDDSGGASRCFKHIEWTLQDLEDRIYFEPKVCGGERELGCENLPLKSPGECTGREDGTVGVAHAQAGAGHNSGARNYGPCLKPIKLTRYLATLLRPPVRPDGAPRRILIPYSGTGSEILGAMRAGWDEIVGIEREPEYIAIAHARIARWSQVPLSMDEGEAVRQAEKPDGLQVSLFGVGS